MTFRLGLTGSIGMGKSTTVRMFAARGYPVWDADAAVRRLYAKGGAAIEPVAKAFPSALRDSAIEKDALKEQISNDPGALTRLEEIVHPLVASDRALFIDEAKAASAEIVVLDIPLLYETGAESQMDGVAVVSTDAATQRKRVLSRPGMTEHQFELIKSRQIPDAEKRARADWIIPTDNLQAAEQAVAVICREILESRDA
ncbi:dephospho-CoA kinase [Paracoccus aerodenitrificans]|uniref:dephospho-CoA kinase n=1 Tax=Paracoccus aerodenitrificans TaxID=3017781 RepID=UPI0022F00CA2|nr:dephospho-CoA kinase [Paracoccus aerodenitrificans]WBU63827.1 dephospho-CoA kinase [Paracoccus aerodenitrificans]